MTEAGSTVLISLLYNLALPALLACLPLLFWRWTVVALRSARWRYVFRLDPSVVAGVMLGLGWLAQALPYEAFGFNMIFGIGGFWDITFIDLLILGGQLVTLASPQILWGAPSEVLAWFGMAAGLWMSRLAISLPETPRRAIPTLLVAEAVVLLVSALGAGWAALLAIWVAGQLNVWLLLIAILLIQDARYAHPPRSQAIIRWLWVMTGRFAPARWWRACFRAADQGVVQYLKQEQADAGNLPPDHPRSFRMLSTLRNWLSGGKAVAVALAGQVGLKSGL